MMHTKNQQKKIDLFTPSVQGIGYMGIGEYKSKINGKLTPQYNIWQGLLRRCYDTKSKNHIAYKDCEVCPEWHNFQTFAKWYDDNFYTIGAEVMHLDKDILQKGNRIYKPDACLFVPQSINHLLVSNLKNRNNNLPRGVSIETRTGKYRAQISKNNKNIKLGTFSTKEEAFFAYKIEREKYIKETAEKFKHDIPTTLYDSLMRYTVQDNNGEKSIHIIKNLIMRWKEKLTKFISKLLFNK